MSQSPARNPVLLAGIVLVFVGLLGGGAYGLNAVVNPPPPSPSPQPQAFLPPGLVKCPPAPVPRDAVANPTRVFTGAPAQTLDLAKGYCAYIQTAKGVIAIRLRPEVSPIAVNNFVFLARGGFYDGLPFHRVCPNPADQTCSATFHVAQAGNAAALPGGTANPGYTIPDEPVVGDYTTGTVGMAKTSAPNSASTQFFIDTGPNLQLGKKYQIFGYITAGMDVAQSLLKGDLIQVVDIVVTDGASGLLPTTPSASPAASTAPASPDTSASPAAAPSASPSAAATPAASPSP